VFPDYSLPDPTGMVRTLSELQGRDPLILLLARGNYCSKEHHQHLELAANYPKVAVAYTRIVTISTDDHHTTQEIRASVGAEWTFLSDTARSTLKPVPFGSSEASVATMAGIRLAVQCPRRSG
jgi:peroxiredoxin